MTWTKIYTAVVICYGLYRQFVIPEQFGYNETWIWTGAIVWPPLLILKILYFLGIVDITEADMVSPSGSLL